MNIEPGIKLSQNLHFHNGSNPNIHGRPSVRPELSVNLSKGIGNGFYVKGGLTYRNYSISNHVNPFTVKYKNISYFDDFDKYNDRINYSGIGLGFGIGKNWFLGTQKRQFFRMEGNVSLTLLPWYNQPFDYIGRISSYKNIFVFYDLITINARILPVYNLKFKYGYSLSDKASLYAFLGYYNAFSTIGSGQYTFINIKNPTQGHLKVNLSGLNMGIGIHIDLSKKKS